MKFETEHGCVVSEMATAYGNSKQIGRYAVAAAMNEVLTRGRNEWIRWKSESVHRWKKRKRIFMM